MVIATEIITSLVPNDHILFPHASAMLMLTYVPLLCRHFLQLEVCTHIIMPRPSHLLFRLLAAYWELSFGLYGPEGTVSI